MSDESVRTVVILSDYASVVGGAEKVAIDTALGLKDMGFDVVFFAACAPVDVRMQESGIRVVCLGQPDLVSNSSKVVAGFQGLYNRRASEMLRSVLGVLSPDDTVVHVHGWTHALSPSVFATVGRLGFRCVLTAHDYFLACPNGGFYDYKQQAICTERQGSLGCVTRSCDRRNKWHQVYRLIRHSVQRLVMRGVDYSVVYVSDFQRDVLHGQGVGARREYVITNPVKADSIPGLAVAENSLYLFVGRLEKEKGVDLFCEAITQLELQGIVVGDGSEAERLSDQYRSLVFTGWLDEEQMGSWLKRARVVVFPSRLYEALPLVVLEAQSLYGLPCVISDTCAARGLVEDGVTGFLFTGGNLESLKSAINRCGRDDVVAQMNDCLRNKRWDTFSSEAYLSRLLSVYRSVESVDC